MRKYGRTDNNQKEIDAVLRSVGASVLPLQAVGGGCPDRLVGFRGINYLLEVKNLKGYAARKSGGRTPAQEKFNKEWQGQRATVTSPDEALKAIGAIKG